jgi:hypothetical protein
LKNFSEEVRERQISKRAKIRAQHKKSEAKIQAKISRRKKGEEEANNLLVAYFENPVVATVKTVAEEVGVEKEQKKNVEEKVENLKVEEKEVESKSIWGNFKEVLKRPPRELQKVDEKKEEEKENDDSGPMKLTLFDLIKPKFVGK